MTKKTKKTKIAAKTTKTAKTKKSKKTSPKKTTKNAAKKTTSPSASKAKTAKKAVKASAPKATPRKAAATVGAPVPDFTLPSTAGEEFKLSAHAGKKVVLFFYPKDATPGCTLEGHEFTKLHNEFENQNAEVYGISRDSLGSHGKFKERENYTFHLLSDSNEEACKLFDVIKEKNMYGKTVMGIERSTFVIDENGKLLKEWRKVKPEGHAQEVLESLKS